MEAWRDVGAALEEGNRSGSTGSGDGSISGVSVAAPTGVFVFGAMAPQHSSSAGSKLQEPLQQWQIQAQADQRSSSSLRRKRGSRGSSKSCWGGTKLTACTSANTAAARSTTGAGLSQDPGIGGYDCNSGYIVRTRDSFGTQSAATMNLGVVGSVGGGGVDGVGVEGDAAGGSAIQQQRRQAERSSDGDMVVDQGVAEGGSESRRSGRSSGSRADRAASLRQQQKRLLLLRHASRCPLEEKGQCSTSRDCLAVKGLWLHIAGCMDPSCMVPHCVSSRCILSHYHKCKVSSCALCGPVRAVIAKERDEQRLAGQDMSSDEDGDDAEEQEGREGSGGDDDEEDDDL